LIINQASVAVTIAEAALTRHSRCLKYKANNIKFSNEKIAKLKIIYAKLHITRPNIRFERKNVSTKFGPISIIISVNSSTRL
jgi:hypothetical protein